MASAEEKPPNRDSGEFAGFMADIAEEIAQRVGEILPAPAAAAPPKADEAVIADWNEVTDRMIEEMR